MFKKHYKLQKRDQLKQLYPLDVRTKNIKDRAIKEVLNGNDPRFLLIAGPCSLDSKETACTYLTSLRGLEEKVREKFLVVPRMYTSKPRSLGGFKGLIHTENGLGKCREIFIKAINDYKLPLADELLYPFVYEYFSDAVSYFAIGARSCLNQEHRLFASGIESAVGFKNPINGDLGALADSIAVARTSHTLFKDWYGVKSSGNPYAHGILRGYTDHNGDKFSNFDIESVNRFNKECAKRELENVPLIIDFSHDNCGKEYARQFDVAQKVAQNLSIPEYRKSVRGFMIESYLHEGRGDGYGYSLTDGCLSFEQTEKLVFELMEKI